MTTPAQEAKEYAAANGFTIEQVGRRYKATHTLGHSFERGGYAALLNEMRAATPVKFEDASKERIQTEAKNLARKNDMPYVIAFRYKNGRGMTKTGYATRDAALRDVRRTMSSKKTRPDSIEIVYIGGL